MDLKVLLKAVFEYWKKRSRRNSLVFALAVDDIDALGPERARELMTLLGAAADAHGSVLRVFVYF